MFLSELYELNSECHLKHPLILTARNKPYGFYQVFLNIIEIFTFFFLNTHTIIEFKNMHHPLLSADFLLYNFWFSSRSGLTAECFICAQ